MRSGAVVLLLAAGGVLAHPGHGAPEIHLHWWEYGLLAAAVAALITWVARR
jgi:hypothetical protein